MHHAKLPMREVLEETIIPGIYAMHNIIGSAKNLEKMGATSIQNFKMIKKLLLKQFYALAYWCLPTHKTLLASVVDDLLSGIDYSQLSGREISRIPSDYIRQVCFLQQPEEATEPEGDAERKQLEEAYTAG